MANLTSVEAKVLQRLAEIRTRRQQMESRKQKLEAELQRLALQEETLQDLLREGSTSESTAATGSATAGKTKMRVRVLKEILAASNYPMSPKDLLEELVARVGPDAAGSRAALQDLLRRNTEDFKNVGHGAWRLAGDGEDAESVSDFDSVPF